MRHKLTGKRHGVVRTVEPNGSIYEASYKDGRMHGLYRWICDNEIRMQVSHDGQGKAVMHFSPRFQELVRNDPFDLFAKLKPIDLRRTTKSE